MLTGQNGILNKAKEAKEQEVQVPIPAGFTITNVEGGLVIIDSYGNEYIILYKPHPRAIPTQEQEEFFNSLDIKVLPGRLPMEAISFVYPNLKLGGFGSSLYLSVDKGKTLFFIANNKQELVSPLDELYDSLFSDAKFYN